jgi:uncharacterized protein (DUF433 family)
MGQATTYAYITRRDDVLSGEPIVESTRTPVRSVVEEWRLGTPPEEIPQGMPHLTQAQVFAALAYYSDHQDEINAYIAHNRIPADLIDKELSGEELVRRRRDRDSS